MVAAAKAAQDMAARMPLGRSGSLPLLVMLVAPLTLRSVHPSSLDSRRSVSVSPRSGMIDGGTAVKVCLEPSDSLAPLVLNRTKCALYSAADDDNSPIYGVRPAITFGSAGRNFSATSVWNASCAVCVLPPVIVPGTSEMVLGVVSRATGNTSWSSSTRVAYFDPAEVAFSLRPYIAERNGSLLLAPHASMATTSSTFDVALHAPAICASRRPTSAQLVKPEHVKAGACSFIPARWFAAHGQPRLQDRRELHRGADRRTAAAAAASATATGWVNSTGRPG